jgi:hypothetical protein
MNASQKSWRSPARRRQALLAVRFASFVEDTVAQPLLAVLLAFFQENSDGKSRTAVQLTVTGCR